MRILLSHWKEMAEVCRGQSIKAPTDRVRTIRAAGLGDGETERLLSLLTKAHQDLEPRQDELEKSMRKDLAPHLRRISRMAVNLEKDNGSPSAGRKVPNLEQEKRANQPGQRGKHMGRPTHEVVEKMDVTPSVGSSYADVIKSKGKGPAKQVASQLETSNRAPAERITDQKTADPKNVGTPPLTHTSSPSATNQLSIMVSELQRGMKQLTREVEELKQGCGPETSKRPRMESSGAKPYSQRRKTVGSSTSHTRNDRLASPQEQVRYPRRRRGS